MGNFGGFWGLKMKMVVSCGYYSYCFGGGFAFMSSPSPSSSSSSFLCFFFSLYNLSLLLLFSFRFFFSDFYWPIASRHLDFQPSESATPGS